METIGGLHPRFKTYERQACFVGHSHEAPWREDILSACAEVLPRFGLEPWCAADHLELTKPLRDKVVEMIANARYGIYDLSSWQDRGGKWHLPRNVLIELGMAISLNRPTLLLRHTSNAALLLPACLSGADLMEFAGEGTLRKALEERLPQWFDVSPDRDWLNRFCIYGGRVCSFREEHPRSKQWGQETLHCLVSDGLDKDDPGFQVAERTEIQGIFESVFSRYSGVAVNHLAEFAPPDAQGFTLCSHCQAVRSAPFAVYCILSHAPSEIFTAIGMSLALEALFGYTIPKVLLVRHEQDLPSLLRGYDIVEAASSSEIRRKLNASMPQAMQAVRKAVWHPRPLPFIEVSALDSAIGDREAPDSELLEEVHRILNTWNDLRDQLGAVLARIVARLRCTHCTAFFAQEQNSELFLFPRASFGSGADTVLSRRFRADEGVAGWVFRHGESVILADARLDPRFSPARRDPGNPRSMLVSPIRVGDKIIGVICADHDQLGWFGESELRMVDTITRELGTAVQRVAAHGLLRDIENRVAGWQAPDTILPQAVSGAVELTYATSGVIYLLNEDCSSVTMSYEHPPGFLHPPPRLNAAGITRQIIETRETAVFPDISLDPRVNPHLQQRARSMIGIPLVDEQRVMGVLYVNDAEPRRFTDSEVTWLCTVAKQAAIAIRRDYVFEVDIEDLDLSVRAYNCLKRAGITKVGEILERLQRDEDELLAIRNFGQRSLDQLKEKLEAKGYWPSPRSTRLGK